MTLMEPKLSAMDVCDRRPDTLSHLIKLPSAIDMSYDLHLEVIFFEYYHSL